MLCQAVRQCTVVERMFGAVGKAQHRQSGGRLPGGDEEGRTPARFLLGGGGEAGFRIEQREPSVACDALGRHGDRGERLPAKRTHRIAPDFPHSTDFSHSCSFIHQYSISTEHGLMFQKTGTRD